MAGNITQIRSNGSLAIPVANGTHISDFLSDEYSSLEVYFEYYQDEQLTIPAVPTAGYVNTFGAPVADQFRPFGLNAVSLGINNLTPSVSGRVKKVKIELVGIVGANFMTATIYQSNGTITSGYSTEALMTNTLFTGWASYVDTQYNPASTFAVPANTDTVVPNNAGNIIDSQKPLDVTTFYDSASKKITGRNGDGLDLMLYFQAIPSSQSQFIDIWLDIGIPGVKLYEDTKNFPKGTGAARGVLYSLPSAYTLGTWEANGAQLKVRSSSSFQIHSAVFNFDRSHKAVG